mmetsp:Transcript_106204/g.216525  ORF Transcript_106204/g.216525 Transcript_106204/m.216525 type:complete len:211 (+) Transcript_106204:2421-3053(+)
MLRVFLGATETHPLASIPKIGALAVSISFRNSLAVVLMVRNSVKHSVTSQATKTAPTTFIFASYLGDPFAMMCRGSFRGGCCSSSCSSCPWSVLLDAGRGCCCSFPAVLLGVLLLLRCWIARWSCDVDRPRQASDRTGAKVSRSRVGAGRFIVAHAGAMGRKVESSRSERPIAVSLGMPVRSSILWFHSLILPVRSTPNRMASTVSKSVR